MEGVPTSIGQDVRCVPEFDIAFSQFVYVHMLLNLRKLMREGYPCLIVNELTIANGHGGNDLQLRTG